MIRTGKRLLAAFAIPALAVGLVGGASHARSILPSAGRAVFPADFGCFSLNFSSMTNTCPTTKAFDVPLTADGSLSGWYTVTVTAQGASNANNVGCKSFGLAKDGSAWTGWEPRQFLPAFGTPQDLVTTTWVSGGGGIFTNCDVGPNGSIFVVNW
jgi:hypothetical protein